MRKNLRNIFAVLFFSIFIIVLIFGEQNFLARKVFFNVRLQQRIELKQITTQALEHFTIWEQISDIVFSNPMLEISCKGDCVYIVGAPEKLQEWEIIEGTLFLDESSVIISDTAAQQLYHSSYVVGQELQYEGHSYYIRGVVSGERNIIYLSATIRNPNTDSYEWTSSAENKNLSLIYISYAINRKECFFKKIPQIISFQLEKHGYPEIDMLSYKSNQ